MNTHNTQQDSLGLLENRIADLEVKLAFMDDTIESLNQVISKQDRSIEDLWRANKLLKETIKESQQGNGEQAEDLPPPHY